jgi:predicted transcriptional regulator
MATSDFPLFEITLRKYERPENIDERTIIRRFCMSLGLINIGDTRIGIVELFEVLLKVENPLKAEEIREKLGKKLALSGIRRHLRRMQLVGIVEHRNKKYALSEGGDLAYSLKLTTKRYSIDDTFDRIIEYAEKLKELRYSALAKTR